MDFCEPPLQVFKLSTTGSWPGARVPSRWFNSIGYVPRSHLPESIVGRPSNRKDLRQLSRDETIDTLDVCMLIFAWGGMTAKNGKGVLQKLGWVSTAHNLRVGMIDHIKAYEQFFDHCAADEIRNCGPAYYTKLLFFLPDTDEKRGIIMDQWTARSINLLMGRPVVSLLKNSSPAGSYRVSSSNSCSTYQKFCELVGALAARLMITKEEAEMRLFSEGRGKGRWREYVKQHDPLDVRSPSRSPGPKTEQW